MSEKINEGVTIAIYDTEYQRKDRRRDNDGTYREDVKATHESYHI